jgi:hypothetical protein
VSCTDPGWRRDGTPTVDVPWLLCISSRGAFCSDPGWPKDSFANASSAELSEKDQKSITLYKEYLIAQIFLQCNWFDHAY